MQAEQYKLRYSNKHIPFHCYHHLKLNMKNILKIMFDFCETTTIHGLAYLTKDKSKSTRFIWFVVVVTASTFAGYFLYETVNGYNTNFTSTTIKTKSIQDYPFPAVTFHSGDFNSEKDFERTFLNQFQLTRYIYENGHPKELENNKVFFDLFYWLGSMKDDLFDGIAKYLIKEKKFIHSKGRIFKNEVCGIMALKKVKDISLRKNIYKIYFENFVKGRFKNKKTENI